MKLATLILCLVASTVSAQQIGRWSDARIVFMADGGSASFATIGGKTYIISCAHRTANTSIGVGESVGFVCNDGTRGTATAIAVDPINLNSEPLHDCAIYSFVGTINKEVQPFTISTKPLQRGERVYVCGFPLSRGYNCRQTTVVSDDGTLVLSGKSTPGESGGPIVNSDGELVGTLTAFGSDGLTICCGRGPELTLCQYVVAQCGSCQGGSCGSCQMGGCSGGSCQGYQQGPPVYRPQPLPVAQAPVPGPRGPMGAVGPMGPAGKDGDAGQPGAPGRDGKDGANGKDGINGQSPELNVDALATSVSSKIKPFHIRVRNPHSGFVTDYAEVKPGEYVTIDMEPISSPAQDATTKGR